MPGERVTASCLWWLCCDCLLLSQFLSSLCVVLSLSLIFLVFFFSLLPPFYTQENLSCFSYNSLGVLRGVVFVISCGSCLTTCRIWGGILAGVVSLSRFPLELLCSGCPTEFPRADCVVLSPRKVKYKCRVGGWKQNDMEKQVACGLRISSWISYQWAIT